MMRKLRAVLVIALLWSALWAVGGLLADGAWLAVLGDRGPGVWSPALRDSAFLTGLAGGVAGAGFAAWHWRAGRRHRDVRWTAGRGAWAGALGAGGPTVAVLLLLYAVGFATGHPRPGEPTFGLAAHARWIGLVVAEFAGAGALAGAATYWLATRAGRRPEHAPGVLPPNEALQLPGMRGRSAAALGCVLPRLSRAPRARS